MRDEVDGLLDDGMLLVRPDQVVAWRGTDVANADAVWSRAAGLEVKDIIGLTYNPLTKHYKLAADVDVNYMIQTLREE